LCHAFLFFGGRPVYLSAPMPRLLPFPHFDRPPGQLVEQLPVTRGGVRILPAGALRRQAGPVHALLSIRNGLNGRRLTGVCGLLPATNFLNGTVLPHERTLEARLDRQRRQVHADRGALGKPVLLTLPTLSPLLGTLPEPDDQESAGLTFYGNDHIYRLHPLTVRYPVELGDTPLVIADGHHRAATHAELATEGLAACDTVPVVVIGADELSIGSFLRVIDGRGITLEQLLERLRAFFTIEPLPAPYQPRENGYWLLHYCGRSFHLRRRDQGVTDTDPGWLNECVLPPVFDILDTRTDPRIESVDPPPCQDGAYRLDPAYRDRIQLIGHPVSREQFFGEVLAGRVLPPKSTRFEPRVPSGLLVWQP
jgi:uncharacterized protein (DUF1015 family)